MLTKRWTRYIADYHRAQPGITERALAHARHPVHGSAYEWLAAAVPRPAGRVLDLACGSAAIQPYLEASCYLGVDSSAAELRSAVAVGRGPVLLGDVAQVPLPDASVDIVVMSMALMLVPERGTLAEVGRVLRPGGTFAAMVPATGPILARDVAPALLLAAPLLGPGSMPQLVRPGPLARMLLDAGLQPRSYERVRFPFPVRKPAHADLAVASLYTPHRSDRQRRWAVRLLQGRSLPFELPVPLMRCTATKAG